ncbi:MAG: DUF4911 domain-containing protein [Deltaproteobacteria bacterium]|nr:DUF4911 domain-containing protein [Deltaproteobacteria bacterium]MBW2018396.1 DUF4911 domain-containing protein [Deltaproteobacteria bacterium]MBW2073682.1 DUF4911 domain-containing protein [Deltaproteobacteria bacterium]
MMLVLKRPMQSIQLPKTTIKKYYRIDRRQIYLLKFILEGYDGVAVLRTLNQQEGLIVLHIGPGCQSIVDMIIQDLQRQIRIEYLEDYIHY